MKILVVFGTRPEVIKLAPVITALQQRLQVKICSTGQHKEMLQQAMDVFGLRPDYNLNSMRSGQSLNNLSAKLLEGIDSVLDRENPDWVIVQGDTATAFCAGLAAFQRNIRVGHVEAGLRTGDINSPFPEEANRCMISCIASLHFAPTHLTAQNLIAQGIDASRIVITGNTVVDAIQKTKASWPSGIPVSLPAEIRARLEVGPAVLVTCHRRENLGSVIENFCNMLIRLSDSYPAMQWIFPVHPNPDVREPVHRMLAGRPNLLLTDPVDYNTSLYLTSQVQLVLSDSGGIQEEAPSFGTPVVVMRQHTERKEGVHAGFATLAGQNIDSIVAAVDDWLIDEKRRLNLRNKSNPYGDGNASSRILAKLMSEPFEEFQG